MKCARTDGQTDTEKIAYIPLKLRLKSLYATPVPRNEPGRTDGRTTRKHNASLRRHKKELMSYSRKSSTGFQKSHPTHPQTNPTHILIMKKKICTDEADQAQLGYLLNQRQPTQPSQHRDKTTTTTNQQRQNTHKKDNRHNSSMTRASKTKRHKV